MKRSKHLKDPLILFLILILTAGIAVAASGDDFGSDADDAETTQSDNTTELRSGFGDDTDDAGPESETSTSSDTSTSEGDDAGTSENGFGSDSDDTNDAEFTQSQTDSSGENDDAGTSRDGFGDDTDDEGPSSSDGIDVDSDNETVDRDGFGEDTDDAGTSRNNFGNDTDDEGTSRDNFGEEQESSENQTEENQTETTSIDNETTAVEIQSVDWPNSVRMGSNFEVCAEVSASETPEVTLLVDGVEVDSISQSGNSCFTTTLEQPGDHTLEIRAELDDMQDSETATVNAYTLDTDNDNQATGDANKESTNNGLIVLIILAVIAAGSAVIYRIRG